MAHGKNASRVNKIERSEGNKEIRNQLKDNEY